MSRGGSAGALTVPALVNRCGPLGAVQTASLQLACWPTLIKRPPPLFERAGVKNNASAGVPVRLLEDEAVSISVVLAVGETPVHGATQMNVNVAPATTLPVVVVMLIAE